MALTRSITSGSPEAAQLQTLIKGKLVDLGYSGEDDETLAEYVTVMIVNDKSHAQVDEELIDLIGADLYDPGFGQWLFSLLATPEPTPSSSAPAPPSQLEPIKAEPFPQTSTPTPSAPPAPMERVPHHTTHPQESSRLLRGALHDAASRQDQSGGKSVSKGTVQRHSRREIHGTPYGAGNVDPARRNRGRDASEDDTTFSIQLPSQNKKNVYLAKGQSQGTVIPAPSSQTVEGMADSLKRCSFWPNCTKGHECPYFHPTQLCSLYPMCPNTAETCRFIHPAGSESSSSSTTTFSDTNRTPCRFAEGCTNPRCSFAHPRGRRLPGSGGASGIPCRFAGHCTNPSCPFQHQDPGAHGPHDPSQDIGELLAPEASITPSHPQGGPSRPSATGHGKKLAIPCREGEACERKATCIFLHPGETPTTPQVPCRFGAQCTRKDCIYKHPHRHRSVRFGADGKPIPDEEGDEEGQDSMNQRKSDRSFVAMDDGATEKLYVPNQGTSHLMASRRDWKGQEALQAHPTASTESSAAEEDGDVVMGLS
ncbi:hypothetical protein BJ684DRAFT_16787 [Piptocephalis cylindrospora]|uniref:C3H1-type domain-containing protein n=1 Tax=Piptocephalis cylindrospora TaxID=1907219 RepID=A0A4P9Y3Q4_9FUNG|nr:hypothetical protein BJ684DRAFT_16787 [Piptocephalis cylindrospora]|eukprot:RKP12761.1 hypothetical protein BJ684DRAFT_16787 [Piptocephalis cylindrospora]